MKITKNKALELYIHIPFCVRKCHYCDFLSGPASREIQKSYVNALIREIKAFQEETEYSVSSIFIGGGTPSILEPDWIADIMREIREKFQIAEEAEITIEANPGTLSKEKLLTYQKCGINRLSMGLQSPDTKELKTLGRIHDYQTFLENYQLARECGFTNINVDLMFGLPEQTTESWRDHLRKIAELGPEHISAYSLIIEEGTLFAKKEQELFLPDEDDEYTMYEDTAEILSEYGYGQYEISNYAKPGFYCRHNDGYWTLQEYLGFGIGAASYYKGERFSNIRNLRDYLKDSAELSKIRENYQLLSREERIEEFMFLGLRRTQGISKKVFLDTFGVPVEYYYEDVIRKYTEYALLQETENSISLTRMGIHVSNVVMADFLLS